jgi:hypothetical protein
MPERKRRKSRGKCLVWRGISACKSQRRLLAKRDFVVKMGTAQKAFTPMGTWPLYASSARGRSTRGPRTVMG